MELPKEECERNDIIIVTCHIYILFCLMFYACVLGLSLRYTSIGWTIFNTFLYGVVSFIMLFWVVDRAVYQHGTKAKEVK